MFNMAIMSSTRLGYIPLRYVILIHTSQRHFGMESCTIWSFLSSFRKVLCRTLIIMFSNHKLSRSNLKEIWTIHWIWVEKEKKKVNPPYICGRGLSNLMKKEKSKYTLHNQLTSEEPTIKGNRQQKDNTQGTI